MKTIHFQVDDATYFSLSKWKGNLPWSKFILGNIDVRKAYMSSPDFKKLEQFLDEARGLRGTKEYALIRQFVELLRAGRRELPYR
jgi:hypothetical protein